LRAITVSNPGEDRRQTEDPEEERFVTRESHFSHKKAQKAQK
jgi:hypothetical protein